MAAKNTGTREIPHHHRENAEWLTSSICSEYRKRASKLGDSSYSARRDLQRELQHRCDITELEALNIINGYHADQYVIYYERMRNHVVVEKKERKSRLSNERKITRRDEVMAFIENDLHAEDIQITENTISFEITGR